MEVGGILAPGMITGTLLNQWRSGDRLLVEVVHKTAEDKGTVRINGQDVLALLETSTQVGDKFWVRVGNTSQESLLLIREPLQEKQGDVHLAPQQFPQLTERGLPINQEILTLIETFSSRAMDIQGTMSDEFMVNLRKSIPEWGGLSEENGAEELVEFLRKLGINYEHRLAQIQKLDPRAKEAEIDSLKDTYKYKLLEALQNKDAQAQEHDSQSTHLLQIITAQQLWLKTGTLDNAFMLLHLPLLNQEQLVPAHIAIESSRKGSKMDEKHCRIAIQVETQQFGDVGIDAYFNQDSLFFRILTRDTQVLPQLLEIVMPQTRVIFSKLGFNLESVEMGDLDKNLEFQNFLKGSRRSGVDIQS